MTDNLTQQLAERAESFTRQGGTELHIEQVLARAGEIRRGRRMRATMVMAACVLAIAVPTALVATGSKESREHSPARPVEIDRAPIGIDGLKAGAKPRIGWFDHKVWTGADGAQIEVSGGSDPAAVAQVGKSLLVATTDESGQRVTFVPASGASAKPLQSWPLDGAVAVSSDGDLAAFVQPDGTPVFVKDDGELHQLKRIPRGDGFTAAAILGAGCSRPDLSGCAILVDTRGAQPATWIAYAAGETREFDTDMRSIADIDAYSRTAGVTSVSDTGSCSALEMIGDRTLWKTCDHSLLSFSPDAQHLLATTAYRDGAGDSELAVLDCGTGKAVLDLKTADGAFITQLVWEDDTHVLAAVFEGGRWAVIRVGLDGKREYAVAPVPGDQAEAPFVLPTR